MLVEVTFRFYVEIDYPFSVALQPPQVKVVDE